jgi:hypothetical protein
MSKISEGIAGAVGGGIAGQYAPDAYNKIADKTGLPKVDPDKQGPFGVDLDTITTVGGAYLGHGYQKDRKAKKEAEKIAQTLASQQSPQAATTPPSPSASSGPPKVGSTGQAIISGLKNVDVTNLSKKALATAILGYLAKKAYDAYKDLPKLDSVLTPSAPQAPSSEPAASAPPATPVTGTQTNPDVNCQPDPVTGRLPPGCGKLNENKSSISEGLDLAQENIKGQIAKNLGKGYDYLKDLYLKRIGQTSKKDVEDWYKQHGSQPASPILKPGSDFKKGEPITYSDIKKWDELPKEQQQILFDKLSKTKAGRNTLAGLGAGAIGGTIGTGMYMGSERAFDQAMKDSPKPEVKPLKPQKKKEEPAVAPAVPVDSDERQPGQLADPITQDQIDQWRSDDDQAASDNRIRNSQTAPAPEAPSQSCVVNGDVLDLSPEDCARFKDMSIQEEKLDELSPKAINAFLDKASAAVRGGRPEPAKINPITKQIAPPGWKVAAGKVAKPGTAMDHYAKVKAIEPVKENTNQLINLIAQTNKIKDPNLIYAGQKLTLPGGLSYTIKPGDNLTKIANAMLKQQRPEEPMQTVTITAPRPSSKYPDSGLEPGQTFSDPRNNPGNLRFFKNLNKPGYVLDKAIGVDKNGFAVFATPKDGLDAMRRQIAIDARKGFTGREFIHKYAPVKDRNDPELYTKNVFGELGLDPDQQIDPRVISMIQPLMVRQEHGPEGMYYYYPETDPRNKITGLNEMEILQRFLDRQLEKDKEQKPVPNPNAVYKKPGAPKSAPHDISQPEEPVEIPGHYLERDRPKLDAEVQKRMQQLQQQNPKKVPENKVDMVNKVIGAGRYVVFNATTGLRLQTNDINKAVNAAQLMAKKDLNRPTMVYDTQTKFPVAAYRGSEEMYQQRNVKHESKGHNKK